MMSDRIKGPSGRLSLQLVMPHGRVGKDRSLPMKPQGGTVGAPSKVRLTHSVPCFEDELRLRKGMRDESKFSSDRICDHYADVRSGLHLANAIRAVQGRCRGAGVQVTGGGGCRKTSSAGEK